MNDIHRWLRSDKSFEVGLQILKNVDPHNALLFLIESEETSYTRQLLQQELSAWADRIPETSLMKKHVRSEPAPRNVNPEVQVDISKLPSDFKPSLIRSGAILSEVNFIKGRLKSLPLHSRGIQINRIMELYNERRSIWQRIEDYFKPKEKEKPETPTSNRLHKYKEDDAELNVRIRRLQQLISKHRNNPTKVDEVRELKNKLSALKWERELKKESNVI